MVTGAHPQSSFSVDGKRAGARIRQYLGVLTQQVQGMTAGWASNPVNKELIGPGNNPYPVILVNGCLVGQVGQGTPQDLSVGQDGQLMRGGQDEITLQIKAGVPVYKGSVPEKQ